MHINVPISAITSLPSDKLGALVATLAAERPEAFGAWLLSRVAATDDVEALLVALTEEKKVRATRAPRARKPAAEGESTPEGKRTKAAKVDDQRAAEILIGLTKHGAAGRSLKELADDNGLTTGQAKGLVKRWVDGGKAFTNAAGRIVAV